jgi:hypothetical protein
MRNCLLFDSGFNAQIVGLQFEQPKIELLRGRINQYWFETIMTLVEVHLQRTRK